MDKEYVRKQLEEKGFVQINEPGLVEIIDLDNFILKNQEERLRDNGEEDVAPELRKRFETVAHTLKARYVDEVYGSSEYVKFIVWEGVDYDNQHWHTDYFEGYNSFFLMYFDDQSEETGGAIRFKWGNTDAETATFYPKRGDVFWVSNKRGYFHRADPVTPGTRRRAASFDFNIENF